MKFQTVMFDLDGTLIESGPGIFGATRAMMRDMGIPDLPDKTMKLFIGPPLTEGFSKILGLDEEGVRKAIDLYHHHYRATYYKLIKPYAGTLELLDKLKRSGRRVCIITAKTETVAREHIKQMGFLDSVEYIRGASAADTGGKAELIRMAINDLGIQNELKSVIMIGDRYYDLDGAHANGIGCIAVSYGYGEPEELAGCKPEYTVATVSELGELLFRD